MSFIFFIITFLLVIVLFILAIFGKFISAILGLFRGNKSQRAGAYGGGGYHQRSEPGGRQNREESNKVFSKDEGEYVSYEEIE